MSDDDIGQLKRMRERGEISNAEYEVLRRHVLWGTPLPEALQSLSGEGPQRHRRGRHSRAAEPQPHPAEPRHEAEHYLPPEGPPHPAVPHSGPGGPLPYPVPPPARHPYPGPPAGSVPVRPPPPGWPAPPGPGAQPGAAAPPGQGAQPGPPGGWDEDARRRAGADPDWRPHPDPLAEPAPHRPAAAAGEPAEPEGKPGKRGGKPGRRGGAEAEPGGRKRKDRKAAAGEAAARHPATAGRPPAALSPAEARRRSRRRRGQAAFLLSMLIVVALVGAGVWWFVLRTVGVPPAEYARAVCSQVQGWHDDVTARSGELQQALNSNSDPEATRAALASFFDQVAGRTGELRTGIDGIGAPAISAGPSYLAGLDRKLDDTTAAFRDSARRSRDLNVADRAAFTVTVQVLQSQVDQLIGGVTGSLADPSTPSELRTAYNNASGCAPFTG